MRRNTSENPPCPYCGYRLIKNGKKKLKYKTVQQYYCKRCKKSISDNKPKHFTFPLVAIKSAVRLRIEGLSLERIRKVINRTFHVLIKSKTTIHYWSNWFLIACAAIFPKLGKLLHMDDTQVKTWKNSEKFYFFAIKDSRTKLIVGWSLSKRRNSDAAAAALDSAKQRFLPTYEPEKIRTDSFKGYRPAIVKVFKHRVKHERIKSFKEHSNNMIEEFFRNKHRWPRFRSIESMKRFLENWINAHNNEILERLKEEGKILLKIIMLILNGTEPKLREKE